MCQSNTATQVCGRPLHTLKASNTRHVWGPACSRAMHQHIIRHALNLRSCTTLHMDEVEAAMHIVRPDGKRWSAEFDRLMIPRVRDALQGRFRALGKAGVWRYDGDGEVVYEGWARAFVREDWDGVSFGREDAERLLAMGEDEKEDEDERGTVAPEDSVSNVFMLTPPATPIRSRVPHRAQLPPVAEEEEEPVGVAEEDDAAEFDALSFAAIRALLLEAAGNLFDFKVHIDLLAHGIVIEHDNNEHRQAEAMRDVCVEELRVLEGALERAAVREMGIRDAGRAKAPRMEFCVNGCITMSELNSITSRDMEDWLNSKGELTEEQKRWQTLDAKKKQAAAEGGNINKYTNWKTNNINKTANPINTNNTINANAINIDDDDDDDDRRSVLSSRIMRSGLTNIGQLVRTAPGLQSAQDRRAVEAAMRDPRYEAAWKGTKTKTMPSARQPRGTVQPLSSVPFVSKPQSQQSQQHHDHQQQQQQQQQQQHNQHQHQNTPFPSLQAVDAELSRVLQTQKRHLLDAVDCNVRINELYWHRHAMMERDADSPEDTPENNTAKE